MPDERWVPITEDDLKAAGYGTILENADALSVGDVVPSEDAIESAVARVRRAVSAANPLDTDVTKVPRSLKALTVRMALYALMERIGLPLSEDQRATRKEDLSDLLRIADRKVLVEAPDDPATQTVANLGSWNSENKLIPRGHPVPRPGVQHPATPGKYANPDAPADTGADA